MHAVLVAEAYSFLKQKYEETNDPLYMVVAYKILAAYVRAPETCIEVLKVDNMSAYVDDEYDPHLVVTFRCQDKNKPLRTYVISPYVDERGEEV
ncbi:MAG: hypothetical protein ACK4SY_06760 [Pyrobaculum sp.]